MNMIQKSFKTWCLLNENIKTNQEVKKKYFKLLKKFFFKFPTVGSFSG